MKKPKSWALAGIVVEPEPKLVPLASVKKNENVTDWLFGFATPIPVVVGPLISAIIRPFCIAGVALIAMGVPGNDMTAYPAGVGELGMIDAYPVVRDPGSKAVVCNPPWSASAYDKSLVGTTLVRLKAAAVPTPDTVAFTV